MAVCCWAMEPGPPAESRWAPWQSRGKVGNMIATCLTYIIIYSHMTSFKRYRSQETSHMSWNVSKKNGDIMFANEHITVQPNESHWCSFEAEDEKEIPRREYLNIPWTLCLVCSVILLCYLIWAYPKARSPAMCGLSPQLRCLVWVGPQSTLEKSALKMQK